MDTRTLCKNNHARFTETTKMILCGCHTASALTPCMPECNSSRQRAGKLLHIWACVFESCTTMTAGVGLGSNGSTLSTFCVDCRGGNRERPKHKEQKSYRGRKRAGHSGRRSLNRKYNTTAALSPPLSELGKLLHRPSMRSAFPRSFTLFCTAS
mgnify:CR=1 FL=1